MSKRFETRFCAALKDVYRNGTIRKARKAHPCDGHRDGKICRRFIGPGDPYFDPRIAKDQRDGHYETIRICADCAGIIERRDQLEFFPATAPTVRVP